MRPTSVMPAEAGIQCPIPTFLMLSHCFGFYDTVSKCWATAVSAERLVARRRARPNLAGAGGARGSHFPALFGCFNLSAT